MSIARKTAKLFTCLGGPSQLGQPINLLPTKTVMKRIGKTQLNTTCQKCKSEPETLGHVLIACTPNTGLMRERHNNILAKLITATPEELGNKFKEQKIP